MSICSDLSNVSISIRGEEVNVEKALDDTIRALQQHLNQLQCVFREIAMSSEQQLGNEIKVETKDYGQLTISEDLLSSCKQVDMMQEHIVKMNGLFDDLMSMSMQLTYEPESLDEKKYLKEYKVTRKNEVEKLRKQLKDERDQWNKLAKEQNKKAKKANE